MSVKLTTRQVGDVTVIDASGRITLGEGSSTFRDTIREMTGKGNKTRVVPVGRTCEDLGFCFMNAEAVSHHSGCPSVLPAQYRPIAWCAGMLRMRSSSFVAMLP